MCISDPPAENLTCDIEKYKNNCGTDSTTCCCNILGTCATSYNESNFNDECNFGPPYTKCLTQFSPNKVSNHFGLSGGAIAGIVIGSIALVVIIGIIILMCINASKVSSPIAMQGPATQLGTETVIQRTEGTI
jgi:hypothetical protein